MLELTSLASILGVAICSGKIQGFFACPPTCAPFHAGYLTQALCSRQTSLGANDEDNLLLTHEGRFPLGLECVM